MFQLKSAHGYVLTFTPQSNEFTITLSSTAATGQTAGLCGSINTDSPDLDQSLLVPLINSYHNHPPPSLLSFLKAPVGKIKQTFFLCVTAPRPPTSRRLSWTGLWLRMALCVCQSAVECVHPGQRWDARRFAPRCSNPATPTFPCRCSWSGARSRLAKNRMYVSSSLPTHASADRVACAWTGGAPTFAVSLFLFVCLVRFFPTFQFATKVSTQKCVSSVAVSQLHGV